MSFMLSTQCVRSGMVSAETQYSSNRHRLPDTKSNGHRAEPLRLAAETSNQTAASCDEHGDVCSTSRRIQLYLATHARSTGSAEERRPAEHSQRDAGNSPLETAEHSEVRSGGKLGKAARSWTRFQGAHVPRSY